MLEWQHADMETQTDAHALFSDANPFIPVLHPS